MTTSLFVGVGAAVGDTKGTVICSPESTEGIGGQCALPAHLLPAAVSVEERVALDNWVAQQLRLERKQFESKATLCDQLAEELRRLQADLEDRSDSAREMRELLGASCAEVRAAEHSKETALADQEHEVSKLRAQVTTLKSEAQAAQARGAEQAAHGALARCSEARLESMVETHAAEASRLRQRLVAEEAMVSRTQRSGDAEKEDVVAELHAVLKRESALKDLACAREEAERRAGEELAELNQVVQHLRLCQKATEEVAAESQCAEELAMLKVKAAARESRLHEELFHERQLHEETYRLYHAQRVENGQEAEDLDHELKTLGTELEQKEEDILSIQFDMIELQNKLQDQMRLVGENANAYQRAAEELAEKDEKLECAVQQQEELLAQMNQVSAQLQEKISRLSQELEGSRASYQALEEQTRSVVTKLESERDTLSEELERTRAEGTAELDRVRAQGEADALGLRAELDRREAAATERCAALEEALRIARESAEQSIRDCQDKANAESKALERVVVAEAALSAASQREASLLEELKAEAAKTAAASEELRLQREVAEAAACVRQLEASELENHRAELASQEAARADAVRKTWDLQERLTVANEKLAGKEAELRDLASALDRSRLLERQARERAQEYRTALEVHREFGEFLIASPKSGAAPSLPAGRADATGVVGTNATPPEGDCGAEDCEVRLKDVLISVELDMGRGKDAAKLTIAPWHTRSDYESVVREFLECHRIKAIFADALVQYLEEVEAQASSFPTVVKANLSEIYSRYG